MERAGTIRPKQGSLHVLMRGLLVVVAVFVLVGSAISQTPEAPEIVGSLTGVSISTSVDRREIYIGDLITYRVTIQYDSTLELVPPPLGANLQSFEIKEYQTDVLTRLEDGRLQSENVFIISTFTTGDYVIAPVPVVFHLPDGTTKAVRSDSVPIKVLSLLENTADSTDIKPLKAQYEFERDMVKYYLYRGLVLLMLVVVALLVWRIYRKKEKLDEPVDLRPAWEIAFEKLAMLKQRNLPAGGQFKEFYIALTEIIRSYYENMYNINVMDMTTGEFLTSFRALELPAGHFERTEKFFTHADLVKFAKYVPELQRIEEDFEEVHQAIETVRVDFERRLSMQVNINGKANQTTEVTS